MYYAVDVPHGEKPTNEWIELYNGSQSAVNIGGWTIGDNAASSTMPNGSTIAPGGFVIVTSATTTRDLWLLSNDAKFVFLGKLLGDGLSNTGDRIILRNASGVVVDAVSWGTNTTVMQPSVSVVSYGNSMARTTLSNDTDTASDWAGRSPSPGN